MARSSSTRARPATILDVARTADVSKSTVSLVLQDSPLIRAETAEKVRAAAAKLGYVYNRRAAELRSRSTNTVAVVINDLTNPFFTEVLVGIERRLLAMQNPVAVALHEIAGAGFADQFVVLAGRMCDDPGIGGRNFFVPRGKRVPPIAQYWACMKRQRGNLVTHVVGAARRDPGERNEVMRHGIGL